MLIFPSHGSNEKLSTQTTHEANAFTMKTRQRKNWEGKENVEEKGFALDVLLKEFLPPLFVPRRVNKIEN